MANIISISNQKGGVGKTVTSVNLACGLARHGKKVLLIDLDAQASATLSLGFQPDSLENTISDILSNQIEEKQIETGKGILRHKEGIDLLPSDITLSSLEVPLMNVIGRETVLKNYLQTVQEEYDYILIDCLPSLNILTINALTAAHQVLIPVQAQHLSINGMQQLLITIGKIKRNINPKLEISGILLTMVVQRSKSMKEIIELLHTNYEGKLHIFQNNIPQSVRAAEASIHGTSIYQYDPKGKVAAAYEKLTLEILEQENRKEKLL